MYYSKRKYNASIYQMILIASFCTQILFSCSNNYVPQYWPTNGTSIINIKWEIPIADSIHVFSEEDDLWKMPFPSGGVIAETTYTYFRSPKLHKYDKLLGQVDQEVTHSNNTNIIEFYRFTKVSVLLLGYTNPDTLNPLTIFDPPLKIFSNNVDKSEKVIISKSKTKNWNGVSFDDQYNTTFTVKNKNNVEFLLENGEKYLGILCEIVITQDLAIPFGENNLILPEAKIFKSNVVITKNFGTVLEWGIRDRNIKGINNEFEMHGRELYIEITRHIKK